MLIAYNFICKAQYQSPPFDITEKYNDSLNAFVLVGGQKAVWVAEFRDDSTIVIYDTVSHSWFGQKCYKKSKIENHFIYYTITNQNFLCMLDAYETNDFYILDYSVATSENVNHKLRYKRRK
jgi:hypothetical protein